MSEVNRSRRWFLSALVTGAVVTPAARVAASNSPHQALAKGIQAKMRGDLAGAYTLLRPLAESGNTEAQLQLAMMFMDAPTIPNHRAQAMHWLKRAAEHDMRARMIYEAQFQQSDKPSGARGDVRWPSAGPGPQHDVATQQSSRRLSLARSHATVRDDAILVDLFFEDPSQFSQWLFDLPERYRSYAPGLFHFTFYLEFDSMEQMQAANKPRHFALTLPDEGITPDPGHLEANQIGIKRFPGAAVTLPGQRPVLVSFQRLVRELDGLARKYR